MKVKRTFARSAKADGRLTYRKRQTLFLPMTVQRTLITLDDGRADRTLEFSWFMDGVLMGEGRGPADQPFGFAPELRVPRGVHKFLLVVEGFEPNQPVSGTVEAVVSFF